MLLTVQFPSWLTPEIIPGLPFRWYGLMYIFAFGTAFLLYRRQVRERNFPMSEDQLSGLFFWGILCLILGARIFYSLIYEINTYYIVRPRYYNPERHFPLWMILWPFRNGEFTGFHGMSYHGGVIGGALSVIVYSRIKKFEFREIADMYTASIPLGYTFGRLGNFINGELYGRITASPLGIIFPSGGIYPWQEDFEIIREISEQLGIGYIEGPFGSLNYPRNPSQLYEMFFEGIFLWAVIWFFRNRKPFKGFLITLYLCGYGLVRFFIEYFREPDSAMGYPLDFAGRGLPTALYHPLLSFSAGQILCFLMILGGLIWAFIAARLPNREPVFIYPSPEELNAQEQAQIQDEKALERNRRRKMRNKLR